jgi:hypothetical protein
MDQLMTQVPPESGGVTLSVSAGYLWAGSTAPPVEHQ